MNISMDKAIQNLLNLHLARGVQPSELVDNLFDSEYIDFSLKKKNSSLVLELSYVEELEECSQKIFMRYTYSAEKYLNRIEQKISSGKFSTQWCRNEEVTKAIAAIKNCLYQQGLSPESVNKILSTLPSDLVASVGDRLKLVA